METALDPNEILSREFEYAAQTALQANEDRVRVFYYYLATAGTLIAAAAIGDTDVASHAAIFALLFSGLTLLGFVSVLKLVKLRLAWTDSVRTMCQLKAHYIQALPDANLGSAFRWTADTIPAPGKLWTVAFLIGFTVALLAAASGGGAVFLWLLAATGQSVIWPAGLAAALLLLLQLLLWVVLLRQ